MGKEEYIPACEAAKEIGCSVMTVYRYLKDGVLEGFKSLGDKGIWYVKKSSIDDFFTPKEESVHISAQH